MRGGRFCKNAQQGLQDKSEEIEGHQVRVPPSFREDAKDTGKVPGFIQPHRKDDLADCVFAYGQHPTYQQRHEDPEIRSAEAVPKMNLANPERIWYVLLVHGVPPPIFFAKPAMAGTPSFFNCYLRDRNYRLTEMAKL